MVDVESHERLPEVPEAADQLRVVVIVAGVLSAIFALPQLAVIRAASNFQLLYADMGGKIPAVSDFVLAMAPSVGFVVVLALVDIAVFWFMYRLARRYWIGLLFVPIFIYIAITALISWLIYMPMYSVITLVQ